MHFGHTYRTGTEGSVDLFLYDKLYTITVDGLMVDGGKTFCGLGIICTRYYYLRGNLGVRTCSAHENIIVICIKLL